MQEVPKWKKKNSFGDLLLELYTEFQDVCTCSLFKEWILEMNIKQYK